MIRYYRFVIVLLLSSVLAACGAPPAPEMPAGSPKNIAPTSALADKGALAEIGKLAPEFSFTLIDGTTTNLSDLRGKKVVLNFWATWCNPCREEMPDLEAVATTRSDVVVIGINKGEEPTVFPNFLKEIPVSFALVADPDSAIADAYGVVSGIPQTVFINTDGNMATRHVSILDRETLEQILNGMR